MHKLINLWKKSLMARLVGYFLLLSTLTVGLVSWVVYQRATDDLKQSVFDRLEGVATLKEDALTRWVDEQRRNVVFIAWLPEVRTQAGKLLGSTPDSPDFQTAYTTLSEYLEFVVTSVSDSEELFILDLNGNIVLSTNHSNEGESQAQTLFFMQGKSNTFVQPVYTSTKTGIPTITLATPLFDERKRRVGVLASHLNLARVDRIFLDRSGLGQSGETYLVDSAHKFVSATMVYGQGTSAQASVHSTGVEAALQGKNGNSLYLNYRGTPVIGVYHWLDDLQVALLAEMGQSEAFAEANRLAVSVLLIGAASAALLAAGLYVLARQIVYPILEITRTATQVAAGDLTQTVPVLTEDEVGVLAQAFNQMTEELRSLYQGLEMKVTQRTLALTQANESLQREVSERMRIENALRRQNEYLGALHDTALGLISRLDLSELLQALINRAGQFLDTPHGYISLVTPEKDEIEQMVGTGLFRDHIDRRMKLGEGLTGRVWQAGQPLVVDDYDTWEGRSPQYDYNLVKAIVGVPLISKSQVVGVFGLAYDDELGRTFGEEEVLFLSQFAQLASIAIDNARLFSLAQEARAAAETANASKSAFLANVSHELRTPLTSILGFARIVQKRLEEGIFPNLTAIDARTERITRQVRENLEIILEESKRLTTLINNVLDLEKIEAGKMYWKSEILDIAEIVDKAVETTRPLLADKSLELVLNGPTNQLKINGDRDKLVQVMINLISNAVKFTPQGMVTIRIEEAQDKVVVSVIDSGVGIAAEDLPKLFEKFQQVGDTLTDKPKGTGLGLSISKEIIEHHGGRIWVESTPGQGSTFSFTLPLEEVLPAVVEPRLLDLDALVKQLMQHVVTITPTSNGDQKSILVVDDDENIRNLLRQELETEGYQVFEAQDGRAALTKSKDTRPDLIILDVMMPGMSGFDVAAVLKNDPFTMGVPIIMLTIVEDKERGYRLGVDRYLTKPVDRQVLSNEIKTLLAKGAPRKKILVIDEDASTLATLSTALRAQGYEVIEALTGPEGIEKAVASRPDIVIVDSTLFKRHDLAHVLRFEKGLENIVVLLYQTTNDKGIMDGTQSTDR